MKTDDLKSALRRIATLDETDDLVVTAVLNCSGGRNEMKQRLRQRLQAVGPDVPPVRRAGLDDAVRRIDRWIDDGISPDTRGVVVYARGGHEPLFLPLEFRVELPEEAVMIDTLPSVYHLCELKDVYSSYVVLLCTEDSMRILEVHLGAVTRQIWKERPEVRRRVGREWTKEHYRNHRRDRAQRFVKEMIGILDERTQAGAYRHVILAGSPRLLGQVRDALPKRLRDMVIDQLPASGRTPVEDVVTATLGTFVEEEQRESVTVVDEFFTALYNDGLAGVGVDATLEAVEGDRADLLIMSRGYDHPARDRILRAAQRSGCSIEFVDAHDRLDRVGGVGCLLRYRTPEATPEPLEGTAD